MSDVDGVALCRMLRADHVGPQPPAASIHPPDTSQLPSFSCTAPRTGMRWSSLMRVATKASGIDLDRKHALVLGDFRKADLHTAVEAYHRVLPDAACFPEAGRGLPDPAIADGFADGVARLRRRHPQRAIVVFCLADCWMSWNAAWRLSRAGYPRVL